MMNLYLLLSQKLQLKIDRFFCFAILLFFTVLLTAGNQRFVLAQPSSEIQFINTTHGLPFENISSWRHSIIGKKGLSINNPDETPHWLAGSYYTVNDGLTATLMLNNKGVTPISVLPTLYNKNGQQLELPPVIVEASSFRYIDMNDWITVGGESFRQGNIRLFHTGKDLVLGAQIYLVNDANSLSYEEKLAELGKFDSRRLEGILAIPSRRANVKVVLTNTSSVDLTVTGRLTLEPNITLDPQTLTLSPHETKTIDIRRDIPNGGAILNSNALAFSLEHSGAKWALIARAFVSEPSTGYSNLSQFYNPTAGLMNEYHGAGIQMRSPSGERLKPVIVLRNTANETAVVTGRIPYTRANGTNGSITLPATQLNPNEIRLLNTTVVVQRNNQENIKFASIQLKYNTPPGSIGVATHSESQNKNFVSRVPMWDPLRQHTATGGYPWLIEDTSATKNYIKNITDRPQKYVAFFIWEDNGMYMLGQKELAPYQTIEIDVKDLRDRQVPDEEGNTIPINMSRGQFQWTLSPEDNVDPEEDPLSELALIGRSEQIDWGKKISNNYACQNCCTGNTIGAHLSPSSSTVEVDATVRIRAYLEEESCFGFPYSYETGATWGSNNPSIATVSGGTVTGKDLGNTSITASFQGPRYISNPPCTGGEGPYLVGCDEPIDFEKESTYKGNKNKENADQLRPGCGECFRAGTFYAYETAAITVVGTPQVDEVHPAGLVPGQQNVMVRIVGRKFGQTPTISISGSGVTAVYDIQTPDGFDARFTVAENAQVGQRQLTVSAGGRTSNAVAFTVGDRTPVITSISRSQSGTGQTFSVSIGGSNFGFNPLITFSQPGINYAINSATTTQINATFTVASNASPGVRDVKVVSRGITGTGFEQVPQQTDTSNGVPFQVTTPLPVISDVGIVEKNGLKDVILSFSAGGAPASGDTVKLKLERTAGTGSATFENGSTEMTYSGTGGPQTFKIKGVTESSQVDNYKVIAEVNNSTSGQPSKVFTVAAITALLFERINTTGTTEQQDVPLDNNPGNGQPNTNVGQRIFPDKNTQGDGTDRSTLRVKATVAPASVPNLRVYFASFDLDDPSANAAPIDTTDTSGPDGNDNSGSVGGSKSGQFSNAGGVACGTPSTGVSPSKIDCPVSSNTTSANFKVTMQPGDNFAIAASLVSNYLNEIRIDPSAGTNLINSGNQAIPISGQSNPNNVRGIRSGMLTVWRKLRIETDEMTNVTSQNRASGNFAATGTIPGGNVYVPVPIVSNNALAEQGRFYKGRIAFGASNSLEVTVHSATSVTVKSDAQPIQINNGDAFVIYDDDDYNSDDTLLDGDDSEPIDPIANIFNALYELPYKEAYIVFDTITLSQYNQSNVPFDLNVDTTSVTALNTLFTNNRGSAGNESDDFWVAYLILGYQGARVEDFDGYSNCQGANCQTESPLFGATLNPSQNCDCLSSSLCPPSGVACTVIPAGGHGSVILQEVIRDQKYFYQTLFGRTITIDRSIIAHEIGHQFGIEGDDLNTITFKIMDYPDYNTIDGPEHRFHTQHINILRRRVKSPGQ
jgi:hypothetical protein